MQYSWDDSSESKGSVENLENKATEQNCSFKINQINCYSDIAVQEVQICKYFEYSLSLCYNPKKDNPKKKADIIVFYNNAKCGVDELD